MSRKARNTPPGYVYHVLNRSAGRIALFRKPEDYAAFEQILLWVRHKGPAELRALLCPWPMPTPQHWLEQVNAPLTPKERARLKTSLSRGSPYGEPQWVAETAAALELDHTLRPEGRPAQSDRQEDGP